MAAEDLHLLLDPSAHPLVFSENPPCHLNPCDIILKARIVYLCVMESDADGNMLNWLGHNKRGDCINIILQKTYGNIWTREGMKKRGGI